MPSSFFAITSYIRYWLNAKGSHSLHSPFLFDLYRDVFKYASTSIVSEIEDLRNTLLRNDEPIDVIDFKTGRTRLRTIGSLARTSLSRPMFSNFLRLLFSHLNIKIALETGTSLGINALYLSLGSHIKKVVSIEGSNIIYQLAKHTTSKYRNIQLKSGDLYDLFESSLVQYEPELVFLDADHRQSAIEFCLEKIYQHCPKIKCILIHDIYWSADMANAWYDIVQNKNYNLTVDIFQAGIIFPHHPMEKQHFTLRF